MRPRAFWACAAALVALIAATAAPVGAVASAPGHRTPRASVLLAGADPAYDVPTPALAAALVCPSRFIHPNREPVLLVHGTGLTADESWGWNYAKLLPAAGYDTCEVNLPGGAMGDIQVSAE
ncbi:MAG: hypothetical protein ACR2NJ_12420 [Acidimicrobiales bacterium]